MEETQIEEWYELEKDKATAEFKQALSNGKDDEEGETKFKERMKKLHEKYEQRVTKNLKRNHPKNNKVKSNLISNIISKFKK